LVAEKWYQDRNVRHFLNESFEGDREMLVVFAYDNKDQYSIYLDSVVATRGVELAQILIGFLSYDGHWKSNAIVGGGRPRGISDNRSMPREAFPA
jgi:hypothetical protein